MASSTRERFDWKTVKGSADTAFRRGEYKEAASLYTAILNTSSLSAQEINKLRGNRCLACQKSGDWKQAVEDAQATIEHDPLFVTAWFRFGLSLLTASLPGEAVEALEIARSLEPGNVETIAKLKRAKQAIRAKAGRLSGPYESEGANKTYQQAIRLSLSNLKDVMRQRRATGGQQENGTCGPDPAEKMDVTLPATPAMSPLRELRRESSTSSHMEIDTPTDGIPAAAERVKASSRTETAAEPGEAAERHKTRGTECYKRNDWQGACRAYGEAIELEPNVAVFWGNRAAARLMLGDFKGALQDSLRSVELDPSFSRGFQRAGKALLTMGKTEEAKDQYLAALRLDAGDAAALEGLRVAEIVSSNLAAGHKAIAADDPRTALWHADSALRASTPAVETARLLKVNALSAMGRHAEALSESRSLTLEGNASNPEVLAVRAGTLYSAGNMQLAERVYQEALRMDPESAMCRKGIKRLRSMNSAKEAGNEAFKQGRWAEAHEHYTTAVALDTSLKTTFMAQCFCNRAAAASKLGRHSDAVSDADKAVESDPDFAKAYLRRATAHRSLKDFEAAVRDFEKVKSLAPETPRISLLLQEARTELKKAKRVDLYKILDVAPTASQEDIKKAYKRMALKLHPDKAQDAEREKAEVKFKQLTAAYALLSDRDKREKFDAGWSEEEIEQGGVGGYSGSPFGGANMDDVYAQLFSQMRDGGGGGFGGGGGGFGGGGAFGGFGGGNGFQRYSSYR